MSKCDKAFEPLAGHLGIPNASSGRPDEYKAMYSGLIAKLRQLLAKLLSIRNFSGSMI